MEEIVLGGGGKVGVLWEGARLKAEPWSEDDGRLVGERGAKLRTTMGCQLCYFIILF